MNINESHQEELKACLQTKTSNSKTSDSVFFLYNYFLRCNDTDLFNKMIVRNNILTEVIKKNLPGSYAEIGIMKGALSFQIMKTLLLHNIEQNFYIFDFFEDEINIINKNEENQIKEMYERTNYTRFSVNEIMECSQNINFNNLNCIKGNIELTIPEFLEHNNDRFCFVYIDIDVEKPTLLALEYFWNRLVSGGIIILDDYNSKKWGPFYNVDIFLKNNRNNLEYSNLDNKVKEGLIIRKL